MIKRWTFNLITFLITVKPFSHGPISLQ
uniref:Uncharacterized protein n=1 Tax=Anguilla anguilla TaxID=7936 RepID=A0A0E9REL3_ANGAN